MNDIAVQNNYEILEKVVMEGDLSRLSPEERLKYYSDTCKSLGLNPLTRPFEYIKLNGKLTLYAKKDCTEQLRRTNKISIISMTNQLIGDVYVVTAQAKSIDGREDVATGAVSIKGLVGDALANAYLKAETKAKRRVTLSICGLGMTDESEIESIPPFKREPISVHPDTGEIIEAKEPITISDNELIDRIERSNTMQALQLAFQYGYKNGYDKNKIIEAKDKRKMEIQRQDVSI